MEQLKDLLGCGQAWAEHRAQLALDIIAQRENGALSRDEAEELLGDLIATDKLEAVADDMEIRGLLITAVSLAIKFV